MNIVFQGIEHALVVEHGRALVVEVQNPVLLARLCQSLDSNEGELAVEPYTLWEGETAVAPRGVFVSVFDPFNLPWERREVCAPFSKRMETALSESDELALALEELNAKLRTLCFEGSIMLDADYEFGVEWDIKRYLKAFSFRAAYNKDDRLFDNIILFLRFVKDMGFDGVMIFVNLQNFLSEKDYVGVLEEVFLRDLKVIFLENRVRGQIDTMVAHYRVDLEFVGEYVRTGSVCPSFCREDFAPMVLEQ